MSNRTSEADKAIREAWKKEKELVKEGKGTRDWTPEQQKSILEKGKAYDEDGKSFEGQHMKSAEEYPQYQSNPDNIQFLTRKEHLEAHDGSWQNPTNWYYDPETKTKKDFGNGPFIPCEEKKLKQPIAEKEQGLEEKEKSKQEKKDEKQDRQSNYGLQELMKEKKQKAQNDAEQQGKTAEKGKEGSGKDRN